MQFYEVLDCQFRSSSSFSYKLTIINEFIIENDQSEENVYSHLFLFTSSHVAVKSYSCLTNSLVFQPREASGGRGQMVALLLPLFPLFFPLFCSKSLVISLITALQLSLYSVWVSHSFSELSSDLVLVISRYSCNLISIHLQYEFSSLMHSNIYKFQTFEHF